MNPSLLRYPGGKTKAIPHLKNYIPRNTKEICSPFFGGGSFELYLASMGITIHGYDIFKPLVCFWKAILKDKVKFYNIVKTYIPLKKETYKELQSLINTIDDEFMIGVYFYIINRSSFSGLSLLSGMTTDHKRFTLKNINNIIEFDTEFNIELSSFEDSIVKHDCLVYADPPYLINQSLYGKPKEKNQSNFNHQLLADILNERNNFILSYNNCDEIKELYKNHIFIYPEWKYGMSNDKNSKEILILSKDLK